MGFGVSIVIAAAGAIMRWGVTVQHSHGFNVHTIGMILLVVGIIGFIASAVYWQAWSGRSTYRRRVVRSDQYPNGQVVHEEHARY